MEEGNNIETHLMKTLKLIAVEIMITLVSLIMVIRTLTIETTVGNKVFLAVGIGLSILYLAYRIWTKIKDIKDKTKIDQIVNGKLAKASESILYYVGLMIINHPERVSLYGKDKSEYLDRSVSLKFFEVDFRHPDPYTGTSMGSLAEQVDFGIKREFAELEKVIARYATKVDTALFEKFESLNDNVVFKSLLNVKLWYDQIEMFNLEAAKTNPTFPKNRLPITISLDPQEHQKDYTNMIELLFGFKDAPNKR
jgi:hypothetical protein